MRRSPFTTFLLIIAFSAAVHAQRDTVREDFINAESWFLLEEYNEAEFIFQKLLSQDPDNDNLHYKIGICLLNDPYRKDQSIRYLEEATDNINPGYKEGSHKERTAPPDVLYYLGNAYLVNERLDEAEKTYQRFLEILDPEVYDVELVQAQIQACKNARRLMAMPVDIDLYPVSQEVNTRYAETHPVISGDGNRMAFITEQPFFDEALFIEKTGGQWTLPMSITSMLGFDEDIYPVALNHDGTEMLLYYDDEYIGNLYLSKLKDGFWQPAEKLADPISTKYWESHGCFSPDGSYLYFTSNRKGGYGGLDIYRSRRNTDGSWGTPVNLGPTINSRYNEETPFMTNDGRTLFFSSYGHYNMGGYDIFYSSMDDNGNWGDPVNLGYPINTTDDDLFFMPVNNGIAGYQSRIREDSRGLKDLYFMDIYSANNPRMYVVTGVVRTEDGGTDLSTIRMFVIDPATGDTVVYNIPIETDGSFKLELARGDYMMYFQGEGYEDLIRPLSITTLSDKEGIALEEVLELALVPAVPLVFSGDESNIGVRDTLFQGEAGKPLVIPLRLEKGATLVTVVTQDSIELSRDTMAVERRRTEVEIVPPLGTSQVQLEMTDEDGNIHRRTLTVVAALPELPEEPSAADDQTLEDMAGEDIPTEEKVGATIPPALAAAPLGLLLLDLREESEGELHDYLMQLDLEEEGITTERELLEHLYAEADQGTFDHKALDLLLAAAVLADQKKEDGDESASDQARELHQMLIMNAEGPLREYLLEMDPPPANGIESPGDLIRHLEQAATENGFTMEDVRAALLGAMTPTAAMILLNELQDETEGEDLEDFLKDIDLQTEGINSRGDLFDYLYLHAGEAGFSQEEIDQLLVNSLGMGSLGLFYQKLLENSVGPLKEYLEGLDLAKEGITTPEELLRHLEEVAPEEDFTMQDVRMAMIRALDSPLEAEIIHGRLLETSEGDILEILQELQPLQDHGISTPEELIRAMYQALVSRAYSDKEIRNILTELFPGYGDFIDGLIDAGAKAGDKKGRVLPVLLVLGGALVLLVILLARRRRKRE